MIADDLRPLARPISDLLPMPGNPRLGNIEAVMRSYDTFGQRKPIVARRDGTVIAGNHQLEAAKRLGWSEIAVVFVDDDDLTAKAYSLADNKTGDLASYNYADLDAMLAEVRVDEALMEATGFSVSVPTFSDPFAAPALAPDQASPESAPSGGLEEPPAPDAPRPSIADRFVVPPFTVLDARSGPWQERKRRWLSSGIRSELGRGENLLQRSEAAINLGYARTKEGTLYGSNLTGRVPDYYAQKNAAERELGRALSKEEFEQEHLVIPDGPDTLSKGGTSIFDPVLCELAYRWWCPPSGLILDPFAGGSVRGVVAGMLGRRYVGVDLRSEQIEANREQAALICPDADIRWIAGDSREVVPSDQVPDQADFLFSCPPYADLEVYSDDPSDISAMDYPEFLEAYREIIAAGVAKLADDRFACIVIGDARDSKGMYYNLIGETVRAFADAGCGFYNEAILVTSVGSLPIRIGRIFPSGRKLGKTHQNVLVFVKGNPKRATEACGEIEVALPESLLMQAEADGPAL